MAKSKEAKEGEVKEPAPKSIKDLIDSVNKKYGEGALVTFNQSFNTDLRTIPTGCYALNGILGVPGLPCGRIVEVYGPEASGKSTLAMHIAAEVQKAGGAVAYIDVEHALDRQYAEAIGVKVDEMLISQPGSMEEAFGVTETVVCANMIDLIVIDSVAALVPKAEVDAETDDKIQPGLQARIMSHSLRKLTPLVGKTKTVIIFINQMRSKIGVMYGNPETTSGGNALKYYASIRLDIRAFEQLKSGGDVIGNRCRIKAKKNKVSPPFKECEVSIIFGKGIDRVLDMAEKAAELGILEKSKAGYYKFAGENIAHGDNQLREYFVANPDVVIEIQRLVEMAMNEINENRHK